MMSTIASRRVAISSGFRAMNSTSRATPASRPKMVRYSNQMATVPATTSRLSSQREGSRRRAIQSPVQRQCEAGDGHQPVRLMLDVRGCRGDGAGEQPRDGGLLERFSGVPAEHAHGDCLNRGAPALRGSAPDGPVRWPEECDAGNGESVSDAGLLGGEYPAGQHRQARFVIRRIGQQVPGQPEFFSGPARKVFDQQRPGCRVARDGLPGDVAWRVARGMGAQSSKSPMARIATRQAGVIDRDGRRQRAADGGRIDEAGELGVRVAPGAEEAQRVARGERQPAGIEAPRRGAGQGRSMRAVPLAGRSTKHSSPPAKLKPSAAPSSRALRRCIGKRATSPA